MNPADFEEGEEGRSGIETIRQALIEGEQSGEPQRFDFEEFLLRMNAEARP